MRFVQLFILCSLLFLIFSCDNSKIEEKRELVSNLKNKDKFRKMLIGVWRLGKMKYSNIESYSSIGDNYHRGYKLDYENDSIIIEFTSSNKIFLNENQCGEWELQSKRLSFKLDSLNNFPLESREYSFQKSKNIMQLTYKRAGKKYIYYFVKS